jgi:hypothetical protein
MAKGTKRNAKDSLALYKKEKVLPTKVGPYRKLSLILILLEFLTCLALIIYLLAVMIHYDETDFDLMLLAATVLPQTTRHHLIILH